MARSFTLGNIANEKGQKLVDVRCVAYRLDTHAEVETQYTDANGDATFTTLPDNVACIIFAYHHGQADRYYSDVPTDVSGASDTVLINVNGITIKGAKLILQDADGGNSATLYVGPGSILNIDAWGKILTKQINPTTTNTYTLGQSSAYWYEIFTNHLTAYTRVTATYINLGETTTPSAAANYGKVYTKDDNKLYFQDGAGDEHTVAFV